jgi:hypothetical protein
VLAGEATTTPKTRSGIVEAIRVLRVARSGAVKARTQAANQLRDLLITGPDELRAQLFPLSTVKRVARLAAAHPGHGDDPATATRRALWHLARRYQTLTTELEALNADLTALTRRAAPRLLARPGIGVETAGTLLVTAGDNPGRLGSDAALAALCGASPVAVSSGKTVRHRLNRGGDRQANSALWVIALTRLRIDPATRAYAQRRTTQGKTTKEIMRLLKRYLARELSHCSRPTSTLPTSSTRPRSFSSWEPRTTWRDVLFGCSGRDDDLDEEDLDDDGKREQRRVASVHPFIDRPPADIGQDRRLADEAGQAPGRAGRTDPEHTG